MYLHNKIHYDYYILVRNRNQPFVMIRNGRMGRLKKPIGTLTSKAIRAGPHFLSIKFAFSQITNRSFDFGITDKSNQREASIASMPERTLFIVIAPEIAIDTQAVFKMLSTSASIRQIIAFFRRRIKFRRSKESRVIVDDIFLAIIAVSARLANPLFFGQMLISLDFAMMMAEYCLSQQIKTFGEALRSEFVNAYDECQRYGANHSVFDQLAPCFTRDDLRAKKSGTSESGLRNIIMRWKRDGWIEAVDKLHFKKTSHCPTSQRPIKEG